MIKQGIDNLQIKKTMKYTAKVIIFYILWATYLRLKWSDLADKKFCSWPQRDTFCWHTRKRG
jgi:hypothetical protein